MTQRPPPLRCDHSNAFAHDTMKRRVPAIARETLARNADASSLVADAVRTLADDIESGAPVPPLDGAGDDLDAWNEDVAARSGEGWLATDWFFAETYFYRQLLRAFRYQENGRDPFHPNKEEELTSNAPWERQAAAFETASFKPDERFFALLDASLWGNRVDLSYAASRAHGHAHSDSDWVVDDRARVVPRLLQSGETHVIADNTGTELAVDLVLVGALLEPAAARVVLHVKRDPTFVSDAISADVFRLLAAMDARGGDHRALAASLRQAFDENRLVIRPDSFWNGPRFYASLPPRLATRLAAATTVICKGDANYRRVVGDAMWPPSATFADATAGLPAPFVCVRTMKSDPFVGLAAERITALEKEDPAWRVNGRRGVVQSSF